MKDIQDLLDELEDAVYEHKEYLIANIRNRIDEQLLINSNNKNTKIKEINNNCKFPVSKKISRRGAGMKTIGENLRKMREDKKLSLREAGKLGELRHSLICNIENNTTTNPTIYTISRLAKVYGVTVDEIIVDTEFDIKNVF